MAPFPRANKTMGDDDDRIARLYRVLKRLEQVCGQAEDLFQMARALKVEDTRCTSFVRGRPSKCTPSGRHGLAVVAPVERPSPIDIAAGRFGIFFRVFKPERAESLFQPRIQAFLTAPIEQFGKYRIHERFEMVRVTSQRRLQGHTRCRRVRRLRCCRNEYRSPRQITTEPANDRRCSSGATLNNIQERLFRNAGARESLAADADP